MNKLKIRKNEAISCPNIQSFLKVLECVAEIEERPKKWIVKWLDLFLSYRNGDGLVFYPQDGMWNPKKNASESDVITHQEYLSRHGKWEAEFGEKVKTISGCDYVALNNELCCQKLDDGCCILGNYSPSEITHAYPKWQEEDKVKITIESEEGKKAIFDLLVDVDSGSMECKANFDPPLDVDSKDTYVGVAERFTAALMG